MLKLPDLKQVLQRANLQDICTFFLEDVDLPEPETKDYDARICSVTKPMYALLERTFHGDELEEAALVLGHLLAAHEDVYLEIGMRAGARLLHDLLFGGTRE